MRETPRMAEVIVIEIDCDPANQSLSYGHAD